jgi:hypothetical protein
MPYKGRSQFSGHLPSLILVHFTRNWTFSTPTPVLVSQSQTVGEIQRRIHRKQLLGQMMTRNNLHPPEMPTWLGVMLLSALWATAIIIREHFQLEAGGFVVATYIVLLFATIVFAFRPAWGRRVFWLGVGILLGLHALAGLALVLLVPSSLHILRSFLTVIVVVDLLLTMSVLWRITVAHGKTS